MIMMEFVNKNQHGNINDHINWIYLKIGLVIMSY